MDMNLGKLREKVKDGKPGCCSPWGREELDVTTKQEHTHMFTWGPKGSDFVLLTVELSESEKCR